VIAFLSDKRRFALKYFFLRKLSCNKPLEINHYFGVFNFFNEVD